MRWDRVGRLAMIVVIIALLVLYVRSGISLWNAWQTSHVDTAKVKALEAQHARLEGQRGPQHEPSAIEAQARRLGLAHRGEKTYVIRGLPRN
jgi:cell division protein FtsB